MRFDNRLYRVNKHPAGCQTGLTTSWMFVYTIQLVVKPRCTTGLTTTGLTTSQLYHVNGVSVLLEVASDGTEMM